MSPTLSFRLVPSTHAPSLARAHVREFLAAHSTTPVDAGSDLQFVSALLTSELVTHAVEHGDHDAGDMVLAVDLAADTLHTELSLGDGALPIDVPPSDDRQIVYGLAIIDSLARKWGGTRTGRGTCLWFDLDVDASRKG
jgi:hypothetical protein